MNDQLQQALAAILNASMDAVTAGTTFLQAQLPDVIQQLLVWKLASRSLGSVICIALMFVCIWVIRRAAPIITAYAAAEKTWIDTTGEEERRAREIMRQLEDKNGVALFSVGASIVGLVVLGWLVAGKLGTALQIWLAPKIYLIEYAANLAK